MNNAFNPLGSANDQPDEDDAPVKTKGNAADRKSPDDTKGKSDEQLLSIAHGQWSDVETAESINRGYQLDDQRFLAASPDDNYQWPPEVLTQRTSDPMSMRPCLTLNKLPSHVNQVVNDARQNKPSIKVHPVDSEADIDTADMLSDFCRHIEYISNADVAYSTAIANACGPGVGYVRVIKQYADDKTFNQELGIRRIKNPLSVFMGPCNEPDGSDTEFVHILDKKSIGEFKRRWPTHDPASWTEVPTAIAYWTNETDVVVDEWWNKEYTTKDMFLWDNGEITDNRDDHPHPEVPRKERKVDKVQVMCRFITNGAVLETYKWEGAYIPVARCLGNEYNIEGRDVVSGMVRTAKDAQRMYNYWASQEVEMLALAPKAPFMVANGQIDGHENEWRQLNIRNYGYLEYNPTVENTDGQMVAVPAPQRVQPPQVSQGIIQAKMGAADDIKAITGQFDASLGAQGNEKSGKAIIARQREGDVGTYHYADNQSLMIRFIGRIIIDLIPHVYDTAQTVRIVGEDGAIDQAQIDPQQQQASMPAPAPIPQGSNVIPFPGQPGQPGQQPPQLPQPGMPAPPSANPQPQQPNMLGGGAPQPDQPNYAKIKKIYNPGVGKYDVTVSTGPSFNTKRMEAADAMSNILQAVPELWHVFGDQAIKSMDWPGADKMAKRMRATIPPNILQAEHMPDDAPPAAPQIPDEVKKDIATTHQHMTELAKQVQTLTAQLQQATADKQQLQIKLTAAAHDRQLEHQQQASDHVVEAADATTKRLDSTIDMFDAETRRIAAEKAPDPTQQTMPTNPPQPGAAKPAPAAPSGAG